MKIQIAELTERDKKERKLPKVTITFGGFKNMKIAINDQQPLDEVVKELERLRFKRGYLAIDKTDCICTYGSSFNGYAFNSYAADINQFNGDLTTLAELKEM